MLLPSLDLGHQELTHLKQRGAKLCDEIARRGLGLTVCPVSNRFVVQSLTSQEIKTMLGKGMKVTINSDDPGYFRAYLTDNFLALIDETEFTQQEIAQLNANAFEVSWLDTPRKAHYLDQILGNFEASW